MLLFYFSEKGDNIFLINPFRAIHDRAGTINRNIEFIVNPSKYNRKTIIDMKIQKSVTLKGCSIYLFN